VAVRLAQAASARLATRSGTDSEHADWTCSFVNNMPDGAFEATERQFVDLLEVASGSRVIEVRRHAMDGVPRGERVAVRIAEQYSPVATIRQDPPDVLIVTGSNPLEVDIHDEPYWAELVDLLSWGTEHVPSMLLSCLSAHAALTVFDGLPRDRLAHKCTGVFPQEVDPTHPLVAGLDAEVCLPHSRTNTVPRSLLQDAGYHVAMQSDAVGWSVATKTVGESHVVLVQGHPEYDPSSLLREYHRDARRYVLHERDELPCLPLHCVHPEDWRQLEALHLLITGERREPSLVESYPFDEVAARAPWPWHAVAKRLYVNWLSGVSMRRN
jgi:homoserine O-succinyltransferase/O-acetyltransferase